MSSHQCRKVVGVSIAFCAVRATPVSRPWSLAINVEKPVKDEPGDTALAEQAGLDAIRRLVRAALPG